MKENQSVILKKDSHKIGLLPRLNYALKSWIGEWSGEGILTPGIDNGYTSQTFWQLISGSHSFNRKGLKYLVETGYSLNPVGYAVINKILNAQRNLAFVPYRNGKPYKSGVYNLDTNYALRMLLLTGTVFIYEEEIAVGFPGQVTVLNTLNVQEIFVSNTFTYRLIRPDGSLIPLDSEKLIIIKFDDIAINTTQMGLSPLQAAVMPVESLKEMYTADTALLKNKGVDVLISNGSNEVIVEDEKKTFDQAINERISGARRQGQVATTTANVNVTQLGRTVKELAMWDGYRIKLRDICNVLQVDSGQFNDPDNKKFSNVQESNKALYNDCVIPFTKLITDNAQLRKYLGYDIYVDASGVDSLQIAQSVRAEKSKTISDQIVSLNANVQNGTITYDIAVNILVSEWDFDEAEAKNMIQPQQPIPVVPPAV